MAQAPVRVLGVLLCISASMCLVDYLTDDPIEREQSSAEIVKFHQSVADLLRRHAMLLEDSAAYRKCGDMIRVSFVVDDCCRDWRCCEGTVSHRWCACYYILPTAQGAVVRNDHYFSLTATTVCGSVHDTRTDKWKPAEGKCELCALCTRIVQLGVLHGMAPESVTVCRAKRDMEYICRSIEHSKRTREYYGGVLNHGRVWMPRVLVQTKGSAGPRQ